MSPDIKGVITGLLATNNYKNKGESDYIYIHIFIAAFFVSVEINDP